MKILNYLSPHDQAAIDDMEFFCTCEGTAEQVALDLLQALGHEAGMESRQTWHTHIVLHLSRHCELELAPFLRLLDGFNYYFFFTHCHVLQGDDTMPDGTLRISVFGRRVTDRAEILAAAAQGSYNAVIALGCDVEGARGFFSTIDRYNPYGLGVRYSIDNHMNELLTYAPVSIAHLRALAQACRVGLMVEPDERLAAIFESCAEMAESRYSDEELEEYASNFNACTEPQYTFFSTEQADRQYVYDWLERTAADNDSLLHGTASALLDAYSQHGLLDEWGICRPEPDFDPLDFIILEQAVF